MNSARYPFRPSPIATALVLLLGLGAVAATPPTPAEAVSTELPPLMVTEIAPDNVGYDNFEFFEVTNTTDIDIDLTAAGIGLSYIFADSDDRTRDVPFTVPAETVIAAGQSTVFWVDYTSGTVNTANVTDGDFRAHFTQVGAPAAEYPLVRVTGQPGMANGGGRGIRVTDATNASIAWAYYPSGSVGVDTSAHFAAPTDPATPSLTVLQSQGAPTPGAASPAGDPTPEPTAAPTPTEEPIPLPSATATPDPTVVTAALQITEITPDTTNVGGADGFEFIELYNATSAAIDFSDYTLNYLYPLGDLTNSSTLRWPSTPRDVVIAPGGTLVLWVKNGQNDALTDTDFNAQFGSSLSLGTDLVEVYSAGLANAAARGIEILTNTGFSVNTAYYNLDGVRDVAVNAGIQYGADSGDPARQLNLGAVPANPGTVFAAQVPAGLMVVPADTMAPVIIDQTLGEIDASANFALNATVTDDVQARTVTLHLRSNLDAEFSTVNLVSDAASGYQHHLQSVDLTGKRWYEYYFTASDGHNPVRTPSVRVALTGVDTAPVRLNVNDGDILTGTSVISAAGDAAIGANPDAPGMTVSIDGATVDTVPELEAEPQFVFEATAVNTFFKNGVLVGPDVLRIFDDGIPTGWETIATAVPLSSVTQGEDLVVSVWAGTKVAPEIDPDENNDDFKIRSLRLVLPDGRALQPDGYTDPAQVLSMGDSVGTLDFYDARFTIPADAYNAVAHSWNTTTVADGSHEVSASDGTDAVTRQVTVDNTAPGISTSVVAGQLYQGEFLIDGAATDAGAGLDTLVATLDGRPLELPFATSSIELADGEHEFLLTARDLVGNQSELLTVFSTPVEEPGNELITPLDGAVVDEGPTDLTARATDPTGDRLDVTFAEGFVASIADENVRGYSGTTGIATGTDRGGKTLLTGEQAAAMARLDGVTEAVTSDAQFPYQLFEVDVPADAGADFTARVRWDGTANADAKVLLYVQNVGTGQWDEVDRHVTMAEGATEFTLDAMVPAAGHLTDGVITVLVQHSEGFAGENLSDRSSTLPVNNADDTPRSEYDFTLAWESDTQYYNASYYERQLDIHNYLLEQRAAMNLQYLFHTGDIVDNNLDAQQWTNANAAYDMLDQAELPYGVLAGNHDVGQKDDDYTAFKANFGAARYDANPWYGESFEDNRGHYDLITAGGMDFLMLYQGWAPSQEGIDWLNTVLAQYPERTAILNLHEYMLTTGGLGEVPQQIYDEVVAPNANVAMVFSGHYHDAFTRIDQFDDTGDGVPDRSVYQMLFDYQGLPEGGQSFLRLLQFDNQNQRIGVRTYSPYLDAYNSDDPTLDLEHQEFTVPYAAFGLTPTVKSLATDAFTVDILATTEIDSFADVASGTEVSTAWTPGLGTHGWYVRSEDPYGAIAHSEVRRLTVQTPPVTPEAPVPAAPTPDSSATEPTRGAPVPPQPGAAADGVGGVGDARVVPLGLSAESTARADALRAALAAEIVAVNAAEERAADQLAVKGGADTDTNADSGEAAAQSLDADATATGLGIWGVAALAAAVLLALLLATVAWCVLLARSRRARPTA